MIVQRIDEATRGLASTYTETAARANASRKQSIFRRAL